ncbi:ABC transporter substrate-binding protein [Clostridium sp. DL1XJH146]
MKKMMVLLLTLAMGTSLLVGCGSNANNNADANAAENTNNAAEETEDAKSMADLKVGFAQSGNPNPWMVALTESMEDEAKSQGVNYVYTDANDDMATHVANIEDMLAQDLDVLVVAPMENTGLEGVLQEAADAGVPVITAGRTTTGEYVTTVYSDQAWEGERCAELAAKAAGEDAKIVELRGIEGTSSVEGRAAGFRKVMEEQFPDMEIIAEQTANFSRTEGLDVMTNIIEAQGAENIDVVFCHNDEMGLGAIQAIKDAGLTPGEDIYVISIDGQKEALDAIVAGEMYASVQCSPKMAPTVFEVIEKVVINGETVEDETIVPDQIFTAENAADSYDLAF